MLIRTKGRSNPLTEISSIAAFWFFWGALFGICFLATAQRVIDAATHSKDGEHVGGELPSGIVTPTLGLPSGSANLPDNPSSSGL